VDEWLDELVAALHKVDGRLDHVGGTLLPMRPDRARERARREWRRASDALGEAIARAEDGYDAYARAISASRASLAAELLRRDEMRRRDLLRSTGYLGATALLPPDVLGRIRVLPAHVDDATLDVLTEVTARYARGYYMARPDDLLRLVGAHVDRLTRLQDAMMLPGQRQRLGSMISDAAAFAGHLSHDADRIGAARAWYELARGSAREAGDTRLEALATASVGLLHSTVASGGLTGDTKRTIRLLAQAQRRVGDDATAGAWLSAHLSKEHAADGDANGYEAHLEYAAQALDRPPLDSTGFWSAEGWFSMVSDESWLGGYANRGRMLLGRPDVDGDLVRQVDAAPVSRERVSRLLDLATYRAMLGEPEEASGYAIAALTEARSGGLTRHRQGVLGVRAKLEPWSELPAVRDLDEALAA
jgi:hypothetical protein